MQAMGDIDEAAEALSNFSLSSEDEDARPPQSFRFLDLPPELRTKIYRMRLLVDQVIDLDPKNIRKLAPKLDMLLTSRQICNEARPIFYGNHVFRLFPLHARFYHSKWPLISRFTPLCRAALKTLQLRLGPGWTAPPKGWLVSRRLGLQDARNVTVLKILVECDPSDDVFRGFRASQDFYTTFSASLLREVLRNLAGLTEVQFQTYPSVSKNGPLISRLVEEVQYARKTVVWEKDK